LSSARALSVALAGAGLVAGTASDVLPDRPALRRAGYVVLEADLHVHSFLGDGVLWPWDLAFEARRRGLDVIAITNHNQVVAARIGRFFANQTATPLVLIGEEITAPDYHLIAVGIDEAVSGARALEGAIADIHSQGGAAIAAHPTRAFWPAYGAAALRELDGAEVAHPLTYSRGPEELREFFARLRLVRRGAAAVGSSDYHAFASLGVCRTYVFARERSEAAVIEALRQGRTVAFDVEGVAHGDPELIALLARPIGLPGDPPAIRWLAIAGRISALLGAAGLLLLRPSAPRHSVYRA
jgi:predicted metal-dependent phosphoesterase TrpH